MSSQATLESFDPVWLDGYDDPVVRVPQSVSKKFHRPDATAAEPRPGCTKTHGHDYDVKERSAIDAFWDPCSECFGDDDVTGSVD